jgi:membrane protease YdiL (CAAX protease family)
MKTNVSPSIRFTIITYAFSWLVWLPGLLTSAGLIPAVPWLLFFAVGICGPMVAALVCLHQEGGWQAVREWLRVGFTRRFNWRWWLFILFVPFIVPPVSLFLYLMTGAESADLTIIQQPWMVLPIILLMVTIGGGQEEYGWRGYLLPRLDARWQPWQADLIMVIVHAFWHLPLFFISNTSQSQYPYWLFFIFGLGFTPLINRVYRRTGGSILAAVIFHGMVNAGLESFPPVGPAVNHAFLPLLFIGFLYAILAVLIRPKRRISV